MKLEINMSYLITLIVYFIIYHYPGNVCTHSVLGRTPYGTNLAGATHTQTRQKQVRGGREMVMSTKSIYKISFKLTFL